MIEPAVALTDYILFLVCAGFAWNLSRYDIKKSILTQLWVLFFGSAALASLLGGTVHGFFIGTHTMAASVLWIATLVIIGAIATSCWLLGTFLIFGRPQISKWIYFFGFLFVIYAGLVIFYVHAFTFAIINYLPATIFFLTATILNFLKSKRRCLLWIIIGINISFVASIVEQTRIALPSLYLDYDSVYHLIQIFSFWFCFMGAKELVKLHRS